MPLDLEPYSEACREHADALTTQDQRDKLSALLLTLQRVANQGSREEMQTAVAYAFACVDFANRKGT
jgi:hypothetical protein